MRYSSRCDPWCAISLVAVWLGCSSDASNGTGSAAVAGTTGSGGATASGTAGGAAGSTTSTSATGGGGNGTASTAATGGSNSSGASGSAGLGGTGGASGGSAAGAAGTGGNTTVGAGGAAGGAGTGGMGGSGGAAACPTANEERFSFFLVSNKALIREGGADNSGMFSKLGGNLGGIQGADRICQHVAEFVSPCQRNKVWHAFLSTTTEDAIDRIGSGPWYDRNGRRWASSLTTLVGDRPSDADPAIKNDPPNEEGVPNHNPDGTGQVDNHEILTGTGANGRLYSQAGTGQGSGSTQCGLDVGANGAAMWSVERATCWNWTRNTPEGCPRVGHSWCTSATCTPPGSGSGTNWMSVWNEGGCAPGGTLAQTGGLDGTRRVGSAGGYGGFYCFAVIPHP